MSRKNWNKPREEPQELSLGDMERIALDDNSPENVTRMVEQILARRGIHDLPPVVPSNPMKAVAWFLIVLFDPYDERDDAVKYDSNAYGRWFTTPYMTRVKYLMRRFFSFSPSDRDAIAEMANDGVHWRGDDLEFFKLVHYNTKVGVPRVRGDRK